MDSLNRFMHAAMEYLSRERQTSDRCEGLQREHRVAQTVKVRSQRDNEGRHERTAEVADEHRHAHYSTAHLGLPHM